MRGARNPDGSPSQAESGDGIENIVVLDDDLRRTFFSERLLREFHPEENRQVDEKFSIHQRVARGGSSVKVIGQPLRIQPFDEFGRRTFSMMTAKGPVHIVQGITELTPQWTKVEGITHVWDMRMATTSIPRDTLQRILLKQIDPKNIEHYKKIARFYLQCERYEEAKQVLDNLVKAFPDRSDLKQQLAPSLRAIVQLAAERRLRELKLRSAAGQHQLVLAALNRFPTEGVGGEVLQGVREMSQDYQTRAARRQEVVKQLRALAERLHDTISKENLKPILDEIAADIGENTLDRLAAFLQTASNPKTPDTEKLALAVSGWLLGADAATDELPVAISAYKVRRLIREYLNGAFLARPRARLQLHQAGGGWRNVDGGQPALAHEAPDPSAHARAWEAGLFRNRGRGVGQGGAVHLLRPTPARVRPLPALSDHRHPTRRSRHALAADRLVGGRLEQGRPANRPGRAIRLHRRRAAVGRGASKELRLFGPRTCRRAQLAPRRLPAILDRHQSRFSFRPVDGRRRRLGHRPRASRSVGGRDPDRGAIRPLLHVLLAERPLRAVLRRRRRTRRREDGQKRCAARSTAGCVTVTTPRWSNIAAEATKTSTTTSCRCSTG